MRVPDQDEKCHESKPDYNMRKKHKAKPKTTKQEVTDCDICEITVPE